VRERKLERILLADNDEDVPVGLERTLEDRGYATATALSHAEASKLLFRLILTGACWTIPVGPRFDSGSQ
jgi:CheY-like chemotaxis protein